MGLFDKFKKKEESPVLLNRKESWVNEINIDTSDFYQVYSASIGQMMVIQNRVADLVVKDKDWNVDFSRGIIQFGSDKYPAQFIGSESRVSNTWLWGWENINHYPENVLSLVKLTHEQAISMDIEALTYASFDLDDMFNGHNLSIVTCAMAKDRVAYYRCNHGQGAAFVAFSGVDERVFRPLSRSEFIQNVNDIISTRDVNHKIMVESLLKWNGTDYTEEDQRLLCEFDTQLEIIFEKIPTGQRIKEMNFDLK